MKTVWFSGENEFTSFNYTKKNIFWMKIVWKIHGKCYLVEMVDLDKEVEWKKIGFQACWK